MNAQTQLINAVPVGGAAAPSAAHPGTQSLQKPTLSERIERARLAFISSAKGKVERAAELASALDSGATGNAKSTLVELRTIAHSLSGTAGSFGYRRLSEIADRLEATIVSGDRPSPAIIDLVMEMALEFMHHVAGRRSNS